MIRLLALLCAAPALALADTPIVDTAQDACYDNDSEIVCPAEGQPFHGQDSQYPGNAPSYLDNGDGTVTDLVTGLMWQQTPDLVSKSTWQEAVDGASAFTLATYDDWRLPTIKELYSLMDFRGVTGTDEAGSTPYIDTDYFDFVYGDESAGERFIDAQYWSATAYVGSTMNGDATAFGVNFADGRIKGYPSEPVGPPGDEFSMESFVRYVRGGDDYGTNDFVDNGDGTVTDLATGLQWQQDDSGGGLNWQDALAYAESLDLATYDDWRLPDVKELQSIVDYSRAPDATEPGAVGPAIDPIFGMSDSDAWFWSGTTHKDGPTLEWASYVCFGIGWGWMEMPPESGTLVYTNVHGAGCQRSDPKSGDPADYPYGHGPQGDEVRIFNHVRCVRDAGTATDTGETAPIPELRLSAVPNPFNPRTQLSFFLAEPGTVKLAIFDISGRRVTTLQNGVLASGDHAFSWSAAPQSSGVYLARLETAAGVATTKLVLAE
jgi:hypothetical protein